MKTSTAIYRLMSLPVLVLIAAGVFFAYRIIFFDPGQTPLPAFDKVKAGYRPSEMQLLDRHGEVIDSLRVDPVGRRMGWAPLSDVSPAVIETILRAEDRRFKTHHGVDFIAIASACVRYVLSNKPRGASTITMQLVSLIDPELKPQTSPHGSKRTLAQKWRQMRSALALEKRWSKMEILEAYLNLVSFRGELQGIASAARGLFDKEPMGLSRLESTVLATLVGSPNASARAIAIRACALAKSADAPLPCPQIQALAQACLSMQYRIRQRVHLAPHVALMLLKGIGTDGGTGTITGDTGAGGDTVLNVVSYGTSNSGLNGKPMQVVSTIDAPLQRFVIDTLNQQLSLIRERNVFDGAAIVLDNATGEVLAYVGNIGEKSSAPYVDGIQARRQAGSSLKPFLYGLAIEKRLLTAASIIEDSPLQISAPTGLYIPGNYDNTFRGLVSVRTALSSSINIPAVRTLQLVGIEAFLERLRAAGFASLTGDADYYGYPLALGSADVTLFELTNAYRVLANGGEWSQPRFTFGGEPSGRVKAMDAMAAFIISTILSDREARSPTFGLENSLSTRYWSAVKTGTSKDMRDNWCVGYTTGYTVGVWVGNFSGEPMRDVSGITGAAPVWIEVMNYLHRRVTSTARKAPPGVVSARVTFAGNIETPRLEWFVKGTEPVADSEIKTLVVHDTTPRITYPPSDAIIALDPDIPEDRQFVPFEHSAESGRYVWVLNGIPLGRASSPYLWKPQKGKYKLSLEKPATGRPEVNPTGNDDRQTQDGQTRDGQTQGSKTQDSQTGSANHQIDVVEFQVR